MSGVRILKIRRSTAIEEPVQEAPPVAPSPPTTVTKQATGSKQDRTSGAAPLEPPYDRQCVVRFPEDVALKIRGLLKDAKTTDTTEIIRISIDDEKIRGVDYRLFSVSVYEQHQRHLKQLDMRGVLVDLPTFVESYKTVNSGTTVTKSSDVSQMLICFKLVDFNLLKPSPELQKALNLLYPSGLTPPTNRIRERKFRPPPSKEDVQNMRSAEDLVENVMSGGALEWVVETEVDEEEAIQRSINEPENVWTPTDAVLQQLRHAGFIDANGDIIHPEHDDDEIMRETD